MRHVRRLYRKHVIRRWHAIHGHHFTRVEIVPNLYLCRCGASRVTQGEAMTPFGLPISELALTWCPDCGERCFRPKSQPDWTWCNVCRGEAAG